MRRLIKRSRHRAEFTVILPSAVLSLALWLATVTVLVVLLLVPATWQATGATSLLEEIGLFFTVALRPLIILFGRFCRRGLTRVQGVLVGPEQLPGVVSFAAQVAHLAGLRRCRNIGIACW